MPFSSTAEKRKFTFQRCHFSSWSAQIWRIQAKPGSLQFVFVHPPKKVASWPQNCGSHRFGRRMLWANSCEPGALGRCTRDASRVAPLNQWKGSASTNDVTWRDACWRERHAWRVSSRKRAATQHPFAARWRKRQKTCVREDWRRIDVWHSKTACWCVERRIAWRLQCNDALSDTTRDARGVNPALAAPRMTAPGRCVHVKLTWVTPNRPAGVQRETLCLTDATPCESGAATQHLRTDRYTWT